MTTTTELAPPVEQPTGFSRWRLAYGLERVFCHLFDHFEGCGRVVFITRFSGPYDEAAVERALRQVTATCPRGRMRIVQLPSGDYEFQLGDQPEPVAEIRPVVDPAEGAMVAARLGAESFPRGSEPVLRWVVLPADDGTFQIVGLAHHGLFDAASMANLNRRFLQALSGETLSDNAWKEPSIPKAKWTSLLRHWNGMIRYWCQYRPVLWKCRGLPREMDADETCVIHRWTAAETERLVSACREVNTTVTALLGVTGLFAARSHYGDELPQVDLAVPINLRRYLPENVAENTLGLLITARFYAIDFRRPVSLREQAQQISQHLKQFVKNEGPLRLFHIINRLMPRRLQLKQGTPPSVSANSLGRITIPASSTGVRLLECGWFAYDSRHMFAFSQSTATVDDCLTVTSYSNWINGDRVREMAADVDARLRQFAGLSAAAIDDRAVASPGMVAAR